MAVAKSALHTYYNKTFPATTDTTIGIVNSVLPGDLLLISVASDVGQTKISAASYGSPGVPSTSAPTIDSYYAVYGNNVAMLIGPVLMAGRCGFIDFGGFTSTGSPVGDVFISVYEYESETPPGRLIAQCTQRAEYFAARPTYLGLPPDSLPSGGNIAIVVRFPSGDASNNISIGRANYGTGGRTSTDNGNTWSVEGFSFFYIIRTTTTLSIPRHPRKVLTVNNTGNVYCETFVYLVPYEYAQSSSSLSLSMWSNSAQAVALAISKIEKPLLQTLEDDTSNVTSWYIGGALNDAVGIYLPVVNSCKLTSIELYLRKSTGLTGTVALRVRDAASRKLFGTLGTYDASLLSDTVFTWVAFNTTPVFIPGSSDGVLIQLEDVDLAVSGSLEIAVNTNGGTYEGMKNIGYYITSGGPAGSLNFGGGYPSLNVRNATGLQCRPILLTSTSATGSSASPSSGASGALARAGMVGYGQIGLEGPSGDAVGSWTTGDSNVSGQEQRIGTTGGGAASNITINTAIEPLLLTNAQTAAMTGITSRDWAAAVLAYAAAAADVQSKRPRTYVRL